MKKFLVIVLMIALAGCARGDKAKKITPSPAPAKFGFSNIDPDKAPREIKDFIKNRKSRESYSVVESGSATYAIVSRGAKAGKGSSARITGVTQAALDRDTSVVQISVEFMDPTTGTTVTETGSTLTVAKIVFPRRPDGFEFLLTRVVPETKPAPERPPETGENIRITSPKPGGTVKSPLTVTGQARVFEATLQVELKDNTGKTLAKQVVTASEGAPAWGNFTTTLNYATPPQPIEGMVEAYTYSARDGSKENIVIVPVTIK